MIEVTAQLLGDPVFFSGKKISCQITFKHVQEDPSPNKEIDVLGWASAQIVCICSINPQKVQMIGKNVKTSSLPTTVKSNCTSLTPSRGERGSVIYSSNPKILVCDLKLSGDTITDYVYEETLPDNLPPSFRGQAIKYSYKLKIGLQRVGAAVKLLHVPLRLMSWQSLGLPCHPDQEDVVVSNPFMQLNQISNSGNDEALEMLQQLTSRRSPSVFKVTNSKGKVVNLCLFKTGFRLGEDIIGTLDFGDSMVSCMQYSVTLQSQEIVSEEKRKNSISRMTDDSSVTSYSKHHEFCVGFLQTHLSLPVPLHITPSFQSELVSLKWRLHFEFVTAVSLLSWEEESEWKPPGIVDIETMVWDLPITVFPTTPAHICKGLYGDHEASLIL